ncbi:MAG: 2Fe-2S iron-sulfur cluster binding domain-containing protein [Spirochaetaceae bacterium]|nr:2Fe-2S iron-sulfur cluster binding domain-containing protein [Spirochaetaceae bacterium]
MRIKLYVNDKEHLLNTHGERRLSDVLREDLGLLATKVRCGSGKCGACIVLAEGELCSSCLVPVGIMQNSHITTFEHFSQTRDFQDISRVVKSLNMNVPGEKEPFFYFTLNSIINNIQEITPENTVSFYKNFENFSFSFETLYQIAKQASAIRKKRIAEEIAQLNQQRTGKR